MKIMQEAEKLTSKMQGLFTESYEPLGDLIIKQSLTASLLSTIATWIYRMPYQQHGLRSMGLNTA